MNLSSLIKLSFLISTVFIGAELRAEEKCKADSPVSESELNPKAIKAYVTKNKLTHPHDLICCLPESMRKNYVIVTESFSAQGGAEEFKTEDGKIDPDKVAPRVILFTDGKPTDPVDLSISFNGLETQRNHFNLEMMSFEKKPTDGSHHGFFDLNFRDGVRPDDPTAKTPEEIQKHVKLSEKNPEKCNACHGRLFVEGGFNKVRPRWDSNPFWPRTFGSDPIGNAPSSLTQFEKRNREAFKEVAKKIPGYQCLIDIQGRMSRPFGMTDANAEYSLRVAAGNRYRVSSLIRETKDYSKYKYSILAALLGCNSEKTKIEEFLPADVRATHTNQDFLIPDLRDTKVTKELLEKIALEASEFHVDKTQTGFVANRIYNESREPISLYKVDSYLRQGFWQMETSESISAMRYLLEGRGISAADCSIDVTEGRYRFNNATRFGRSEAVYLAERLMLDDGDLQQKDFSTDVSNFVEDVRKKDAPGAARNGAENVTRISIAEKGPEAACLKLQEQSLKAFAAPSATSNQEPGNPSKSERVRAGK